MGGIMVRAALVAALAAGLATAQVQAQTQTQTQSQTQSQTSGSPSDAAVAAPADYSDEANWLCRPGRDDACAQDLTTTVIAADGVLTRETFEPAADPAIDCFYVYPTASLDPGPNSDLVPGPEEALVAQIQFARFSAACRTFAPMYRQGTLTALHARMSGAPVERGDRNLGYNDVVAAWRAYLEHDNHGRGVVLFGHSQGAAVITRLIAEEIDGKPVQDQLVSAIVLGANVVVPNGADVGGTFKHVPACRAADQTGCVISYVTFRDTAPPPPVGLFAHALDALTWTVVPDSHALCTNPASLGGGAAPLKAYFPTTVRMWTPPDYPWTTTGAPIDTPFVATPGLVSGECVTDGPSTFLAIHVNAGDDDVRTHDIPGDVIVSGTPFPDWGLHRIDVPVAIGDLIDVVERQGAAYQAANP